MKTLTVFTPTYNRRELLKNAYDSLVAQTCNDFVWLIIDDGSDDGTEEKVKKWIAEGKVEIRFIYKGNGGKHTAMNLAFKEADTPLIAVALDSDDTLLRNAVETIVADYKMRPGIESVCGLVYTKQDTNGNVLAGRYPHEGEIKLWRDAVINGEFEGEAFLVYKTEYIKNFSYPVYQNEKFVTEACVYLEVDRPMLWIEKPLCQCTYHEDGYSRNIARVFYRNPNGYRLYNKIRLKYYRMCLKKMKYAAYYDGFSMLCRQKGYVRESGAPLLCALMLPVGAAFALLLRIKNNH